MSKKHDAIFDDVLSGLDKSAASGERTGARFLKRSTAIGERISGERQEKTLHLVDPARCRMWERHNRDYALLTEENCRDLIDGIKAQGQQEFPAIVRRLEGEEHEFEVICGARRHFAVSWLRANNYPQFRYLVEVRDLTDEEAFRLADIENRDREDISDYERAVDYAEAIKLYYGGAQKAMAERLEVSPPWLSRYLTLAKMPEEILNAFASKRDIRERHARALKPLLGNPEQAQAILEEAAFLARTQQKAAKGQGGYVEVAEVFRRLKAAAKPKAKAPKVAAGKLFVRSKGERGIMVKKQGKQISMAFDADLSEASLRGAFENYLKARKS
ncbi:ParB/RepB/Spo0J family partition protein [Sulfitobacter sp. JBTF-M27]|uniref:ParB/RepB/Spo0J family partition protein n=1 Tax=Sulfitobacter sediminilitoris TaxID=2698830 RepID=A0A6P0CFB7_9RHOB|nr:ParB/RepB/Spo0J family partition protein [Sulfitobacter sediminilitoris]NEK24881.1 ParB/RepB/Spo0J family partition protein [Sulfitobacter sediminilitoris]